MEHAEYPAHINKSGEIQTVAQHCRETAVQARNYLSKINLGESAYIAGLIHDAGKCTDEFRDYITSSSRGEDVKRGSVIHTFAGVQYLLNRFHVQTDGLSDLTSEILSIAVGSHHGLFDCFDENSACGFTHRIQKQPEYDRRALSAFFSEVADETELQSLFDKARNEIETAIKTIQSNTEKEDEAWFFSSLIARLITSAIVDGDRTNTRDFETDGRDCKSEFDTQSVWNKCLTHFESYISAFPTKTPIQKSRHFFSEKCIEASESRVGLYRLNLPTGGGKTLSGLRFALNHAKINGKSRIFFISPLLSILEQNADEIRKAIGNDSYILEHHSDVVTEGKTNEELKLYELLCESWNAPIIITTLVQFLNTLFSGKMASVRRFHSLADSVIVIDEVQTVPPKMLSLFNSAINFLTTVCKSTVVLCSATQPNLDSLPHPIIEGKDIVSHDDLKKHESVFKRNQIEDKGRKRISDIPALISELLDKSTSVLVVCNKKSEAEELFRSAASLCERSYHLSAGMCIAHRKDILADMRNDLESGKKVLCISTQVIEAGVDISFGAVIRFAAGIDNIIQAAGRCNRNGEQKENAPVWIIDCEDERLEKLKEIKSAKDATLSLLGCFENVPEHFEYDLASEKSIKHYYQKYYESLKANTDNKKDFFEFSVKGHKPLYTLLSTNSGLPIRQTDKIFKMHQSMKTAGDLFRVFDEEQKSVIVPYRDGNIADLCVESEYVSPELLNKAKPYTVSVFAYQFDEFIKIGALRSICGKEIYVLDPSYYDENIGIISPKKGDTVCNTLIL